MKTQKNKKQYVLHFTLKMWLLQFIFALFLTCITLTSKSQTTKLVGMGALNGGSILAINEDGSNPEKWVDLATGQSPQYTNLIESNGKLWGMTSVGGSGGSGVIFSMDTDGTNYVRVHDFENINGHNPYGSLVESNSKLWGMTIAGGANDYGVIFSLSIDGTNFTKVHDFDNINGRSPYGNLIESNGKLWGMTIAGGVSDYGVIFSLAADGSNFTKVHDFDNINGRSPYGSFIEGNGKLWGMTRQGGASDTGVIFNLSTDGSNFTKVHDFDNTNGGYPLGDLVESNGKLLGMAPLGGASDDGVIFSLAADGSNFTKIHDFDGINGANPIGNLVEINGKLLGMAPLGGASDGGVIFSLAADGSNFTKVHDFNNTNENNPRGSLVMSNDKLWGMTYQSSTNGFGAIFSLDSDGTNYTKVHDFNITNGANPNGSLVKINGKLWGMTNSGGTNGYGTIFRLDIDGSNYIKMHDFDNINGGRPYGSLTESSGRFWGMTFSGGSDNFGVIFSLDLDGSNYTKIHDFDGTNGANPIGSLVEVNGKLWGMTFGGGANSSGVIFFIDTNGSNYAIARDFENSTEGSNPYGDLIESNGKLWGMTYGGGAGWTGAIFSLNLDGSNYTKVHDFLEETGHLPHGNLIESNGKLWGLATFGGSNGDGVIFSLDTDGTNFTKIHDLDPIATGGNPQYGALTVLVIKDDQNINLTLENKTYGDEAYTLSATSNSPNEINYSSSAPEVIDVNGNTASITGVGTTTITASQAEDASYNAGLVEQTITVSKATLIATADDVTVTYGDDEPSLSISYDGFAYDESEADIDPPIASVSSEGTGAFDITLSGGSADNYELNLVNGTYTINSASLTARADDITLTYGDDAQPLSISYDGFVYDETEADINPPIASVSSQGTGTFAITLSGGSADNYELNLVNGTYTINPAPLTITADDKAMKQGEVVPELTMTYDGFVSNETSDDITAPSATTNATSSSEAGTYDIILSGGAADNYTLTLVKGTLTIEVLEQVLDLIRQDKIQLTTYPNPVQGAFQLHTTLSNIQKIQIYSLQGKLIKQFDGYQPTYDIQTLKSGIYTLVVVAADQAFYHKLLKK